MIRYYQNKEKFALGSFNLFREPLLFFVVVVATV